MADQKICPIMSTAVRGERGPTIVYCTERCAWYAEAHPEKCGLLLSLNWIEQGMRDRP